MADTTANGSMRHLIYQPLDATKRQIRVLELYPGTSSAPLECHLSITSLPTVKSIVTEMDAKSQLQQAELKRKKARIRQLETETRVLEAVIKVIKLETLRKANESEVDALLQHVSELLEATPDEELAISRLKDSLRRLQSQGIRQKEVLSRIAKQCNTRTKASEKGLQDGDTLTGPEAVNDSVTHIEASGPDETGNDLQAAGFKEYEAISYCWGKSKSTSEVLLDGFSFEAPSTSVEVLRQLRYGAETRVLWIDALCVDQQNFSERNQQVAMMGDVYTNSTRTLIWLGPSFDDKKTEDAFRLCTTISQRIMGDDQLRDLSDTDSIAAICEEVPIPDIYDPALLDVVFACEWFTRTWVWQEAALSPSSTCHIGTFAVPWQDVILTAFWCIEKIDSFDDIPDENTPGDNTFQNMHFPSTMFMNGFTNGSKKQFEGIALSQIVHQSRHSQATNLRDKIYGLLGMTRWSRRGWPLPSGVRPNYSGSVRDCIMNATRAMMEEDANLNVLSDSLLHVARVSGSEYEYCPSWTPIWCVPDDIESPIPLDVSYRADGGRALSIDRLKMGLDPDVLTLDGFEVDTVGNTVSIADDCFSDIAKIPIEFLTLQKAISHRSSASANALLFTLFAGRYQDERINEDNDIIGDFVDALTHSPGVSIDMSSKDSNDVGDHVVDDSVPTELVENIRAGVLRTIEGRHLFLTKSGRLGIGPSSLREDDKVVVLFGGQWPFILRKQEDHYILVGHAFIGGIMDGEAVRNMGDREVPVQTFDIH